MFENGKLRQFIRTGLKLQFIISISFQPCNGVLCNVYLCHIKLRIFNLAKFQDGIIKGIRHHVTKIWGLDCDASDQFLW